MFRGAAIGGKHQAALVCKLLQVKGLHPSFADILAAGKGTSTINQSFASLKFTLLQTSSWHSLSEDWKAHQKHPRSCNPFKVLQHGLLLICICLIEHFSCSTQSPAVHRSGMATAALDMAEMDHTTREYTKDLILLLL